MCVVLQCVAICRSVLRSVALVTKAGGPHEIGLHSKDGLEVTEFVVLRCVAVRCSTLRCVPVC